MHLLLFDIYGHHLLCTRYIYSKHLHILFHKLNPKKINKHLEIDLNATDAVSLA